MINQYIIFYYSLQLNNISIFFFLFLFSLVSFFFPLALSLQFSLTLSSFFLLTLADPSPCPLPSQSLPPLIAASPCPSAHRLILQRLHGSIGGFVDWLVVFCWWVFILMNGIEWVFIFMNGFLVDEWVLILRLMDFVFVFFFLLMGFVVDCS